MQTPSRPIQRLTAALALACALAQPGQLLAGEPPAAGADWPIPPLVTDGPVRLPNGRVLPVMPAAWAHGSIQVEMAATHAADPITFSPGARPDVPLAAPGQASAVAPSAGTTVRLASVVEPPKASPEVEPALPNGLQKQVFGFLPYWFLDADELQWMQYQLVSTIAYYGVAARSDGSLATSSTGWNGWMSSAMTGVINSAHSRGVKVVLTVTMHGSGSGSAQATLLGSSTARAALAQAIVAAVADRNADGVNLDFEPVSTTLRDQFTSFVRQLKAQLLGAGGGAYLTVCTMAGAASWSTGYDVTALSASGAADGLFVMGYDYSWSGSARAGGVAPMDSPYILDVNESVGDYLELAPGSKLIWGVPYYGRTWLTESNALNASTVDGASASSKAYYYVGNLTLVSQYGRLWDAVGKVPWFRYFDSTVGTWVEGYYDDPESLAAKWDMVNRRGLAGTGMWTLLMDQGRSELWDLIANKFVRDTSPPSGGIASLPSTIDGSVVQVSWRATDPGSGVASYDVQARDRAAGTWTDWLTGTTATSGYWIGSPGHQYEFRVAAVDGMGNRQGWPADALEPGTALTVGGFAQVATDGLNVRAGAGTSFSILDRRPRGERVALLAGPISGSGYSWYQVQFSFSEWPSADYPRTGWMAAGSGSTPYLVPAMAPNVTTLSPGITDYVVAPTRFSPNGDGVLDGTAAAFTLPADASAVRLDVLNASGVVVESSDLGPMPAGPGSATWDGQLDGGGWAPGGAYLLRITATDGAGTHVAPAPGVDAGVLQAFGVVADLIAPTIVSRKPGPNATGVSMTPSIKIRFSEPVVAATGANLLIRDTVTNTLLSRTVTYDPATSVATLKPNAPLQPGRKYRIEVSGRITDLVGNHITYVQWYVTTKTSETYDPVRRLSVAPGTYTALKFNSSWSVVGSKTVTFTATYTAYTSRRAAIPGRSGAWYYITSGTWAGYWIKETTGITLQ